MENIQFIGITPEKLAQVIKEGLKPEILELIREQSETQKDENEFLTRKETSAFLRVSNVTLHDWVKKGIINPYKMGNRTYFCRAELIKSLRNSNPRK